ncbi:hypothetical protein [Phormidium nigroviride]
MNNPFKNEDTLKTGFSFQQEQRTQSTSSFGIFAGAALFLLALGAIGFLQVGDGSGGGNRNGNRQPVESSFAPSHYIKS